MLRTVRRGPSWVTSGGDLVFPVASPTASARALADLLGELGPDAPTCCEGWTTAHLAAHLVVRDRRPDAMPGYGAGGCRARRPLVAWAHRAEDRLRDRDAVRRRRRAACGPARRAWSPLAWPPVAQALNVTEFAIHHEDVRRAQPDWTPRELPRADQDTSGPRSASTPAAPPDAAASCCAAPTSPGEEKRIGAAGRTVEGEPLELLLWAAGRRDVARVTVS